MSESIRVSEEIPAPPEAVFRAWLDSDQHTRFTGARATVDTIGGAFTAWDGYIQGTTLSAEPHHRIVQSWRTSEFPAEAPASRLEVLLEPSGDGTRVTLLHSEIPDGQAGQYQDGWRDYYFKPMKEYFGGAIAMVELDDDGMDEEDTQKFRVAPKKKSAPKLKKAPKLKAAAKRTVAKKRKAAPKKKKKAAKKRTAGKKRKAPAKRRGGRKGRR